MNNQMNNRLTVNDEGVQRMIDNNSAMYYSNQMIIAQNMTHRPVNTIKAYSAKQEEWKKRFENLTMLFKHRNGALNIW
ncbi:hypothetical protein RMCBS344292_15330 [Rhizopus microsporus]|nr:hypothetical protein RMCBS344292_15330 [Rhizopus microsporus]